VPTRVVYLYRDAPLRREALAGGPGALGAYSLIGLPEARAAGFEVVHNLEVERAPTTLQRAAGRALRAVIARRGLHGGDAASVLALRRELARADAVLSTVDTLGLPLTLLQAWRIVPRQPLVYVSVGLLDRMARLEPRRADEHRRAIGAARVVVAYGHGEAGDLRDWFGTLPSPPEVRFVPFGVDTDVFTPVAEPPGPYVAAAGADPLRDWALLRDVAHRTPELPYEVIVGRATRSALAGAPANVSVGVDVPIGDVGALLARARIVALPVLDNAYSGATTTLLQSLALARPVVVTRTRAIADGYGLEDGVHCRLVPPGDPAAFERAVRDLVADPEAAAALGRRGREHVVARLGWRRFTDAIVGAVADVAGAGQVTA
jgi:glycosyltransferase involved in cell wall biosynthesis